MDLHGSEVHRPWSKGTKLLLQVIKAIINPNNCKSYSLKLKCTVNNRQSEHISSDSHVWTIDIILIELLSICRLLTRLQCCILISHKIVKTGTKFDSKLPVEFLQGGLLFGTHIWLVSNVLNPQIWLMTCQQPLVKQARFLCSNYVRWLDDRGVVWKGL